MHHGGPRGPGRIRSELDPEHLAVLRLCRLPASVADLAADLDLPLGVVRILLADLRERSLVSIHHPIPPAGSPMRADPQGGRRWPTPALTGPAARAGAGHHQDPDRRRIRGRQDHAGRLAQRDPPAAHRGAAQRAGRRASTGSTAWSARPPPRSRWTSAGSPSATTWSSTCSARPARSGSGSCGTSWPTARSARSCMADTRRLADCFPSVDYFEQRGIPFVVAVNCFDGARRYRAEGGPVRARPRPARARSCCATRGSGRRAGTSLIALVEHALERMRRNAERPSRVPAP